MFEKKEIKKPSIASIIKQSLTYLLGAALLIVLILVASPVVMWCAPFAFIYMMFKIYLRYKLKINATRVNSPLSNNNFHYDIQEQIKKRNTELYDDKGNFKIIKK